MLAPLLENQRNLGFGDRRFCAISPVVRFRMARYVECWRTVETEACLYVQEDLAAEAEEGVA
jgi:hypothetical protein